MENTSAGHNAADLGDQTRKMQRRAAHLIELMDTCASRLPLKIENHRKRTERKKEKAKFEANVNESILDDEERNAQTMSNLCRQRGELNQQMKEAARAIQQLHERKDARATRRDPS